MKNIKNIFYPLLIIYIIEFIILGISPSDRTNWFIENITIVIIVIGIFFANKKIKFSNTACIMIFILVFLHTIWWYYTFADVPFDFVTNLFWFERNHFDRIAHFSVWFYAYPFAEILNKVYKIKYKFILFFFPLFFIMSVAWLYEIIEWIYAALANPEAGTAFLGSQWDIWDAQKDMLSDTLGALFALGVYFWVNKNEKL
jgi:putative membrane protein